MRRFPVKRSLHLLQALSFYVFGGFVLTLGIELGRAFRQKRLSLNVVGLSCALILVMQVASLFFVRPAFTTLTNFDFAEFARWDLREIAPVLALLLLSVARPKRDPAVVERQIIQVGAVVALLGVAEYLCRAVLKWKISLGLVELDPSGFYFFRAWLDAHNAAGGLYLMIATLAFYGVLQKKLHPLWFLLSLAGLMLTGSRTAAVSFVLVALLIMAFLFLKRPKRVLIVAVALAVALALSSGIIAARLSSLLAGAADYNTLSRLALWKQAWNAFVLSPIVGVGWGNYGFYSPNVQFGGWSTHAHNSFLQVLAEGGIVGFTLYAWLFGLLGYALYRRKVYGALAAFGAVLISSLYEHNLGAPTVAIPLFYLIGVHLFARTPHA